MEIYLNMEDDPGCVNFIGTELLLIYTPIFLPLFTYTLLEVFHVYYMQNMHVCHTDCHVLVGKILASFCLP